MTFKATDLISDFEFPDEQQKAEELEDKTALFINSRKVAYQQTFNINSPPNQLVMIDLAKFCRAHRSTFDANPSIQSRLDGRREVYLRIFQHLNLTPEELLLLFKYGR